MKRKNPAIPKRMSSEPPKKEESFKEWHDRQYWDLVGLELNEQPLEETQEPDHE